ncbi:hypothetical protein BGW38_009629, partial [Lunasporangiospora selenospora]
MELDLECSPENSAEQAEGNSDNTVLAIGNVVSNDQENGHRTPNEGAETGRFSSPGIGQECSRPKSSLVDECMERRREEVRLEGASEATVSILFDNNQLIRRRKAYSPAQSAYIKWAELSGVSPLKPNVMTLINFLSHGHINLKWLPTTVLAYKAAIFAMYQDKSVLEQSKLL